MPLGSGGQEHQDDSDFDAWVEDVTERADPFMAWLGVLFALLVGYELAVEVGATAAAWLEVASWTIWALFAVEFGAKIWLAPRKGRFLRTHWLQALMLAVPALRFLRFLRLLRVGRALPAGRIISASYRNAGAAKRLVRSRLGYLAGISIIGAIALAELAFLLERDHPDGIYSSFGDALLWSFSTVLALQADPVPASAAGRITMLLGFALGLVIVASLAGTVGAYLVDERRERAEQSPGD